ncbi:hypothetical protein PFISCL1PPCAC_276, partial [Pristionchus fissidentatus]
DNFTVPPNSKSTTFITFSLGNSSLITRPPIRIFQPLFACVALISIQNTCISSLKNFAGTPACLRRRSS